MVLLRRRCGQMAARPPPCCRWHSAATPVATPFAPTGGGLSRWPAKTKPVYITTPIFYVNGDPHVGHLYTALLGDALARWYRLRGAPTFLSVGTDEHGLKVQQAAEGEGQRAEDYVGARSAAFRGLFDTAGVSYNRFVRTSEPEHAATVAWMWRRLASAGQLHRGEHSGWYCVADETFVPEAQVELSASGERVSGESGRPVEWACEDNYLFQLRRQVPTLADWLAGAPEAGGRRAGSDDAGQGEWERRVTPAGPAGWVAAALRSTPAIGDDDGDAEASSGGASVAAELSVSRPASRVGWGIAVPDDPAHTVYVWLDALSNYLTAAGCGVESAGCEPDAVPALPLWPPDHQILGKDILKFHAVYWPAFLAAAGLALPQRLHVHAHWQAADGSKMSKTSGNVTCPRALIDEYGVEAARYYLLRDGPQGSKDAYFSEEALVTRCNADLANTLGNLLTRVTAPKLCPEQAWPCFPAGPALSRVVDAEELARLTELRTMVDGLPQAVDTLVRQGRIGTAIGQIIELLSMANAHFQASAPWSDKSGEVGGPRDRAIWCALESLRIGLLLLHPVLPVSASRGLDMLGVPGGEGSVERSAEALAFGFVGGGHEHRAFDAPAALFERLEGPGEDEQAQ